MSAPTRPARIVLCQSRRAYLGAALALALLPRAWAGQHVQLKRAVSLRDELALALKKGQPLVVMVSLEHCPFCEQARDSYLGPIQREQGVPIVQVELRQAARVRDFKGQTTTHDALTRAWGIKIAPTLLFFGLGGVEVAERLEGAGLPDFYGSYLDDRVAQAQKAVSAISKT